MAQQQDQDTPTIGQQEQKEESLTLRWKEGEKASIKMYNDSNSLAVDGDTLYFRSGFKAVHANRNNTWKQLSDCPYYFSSLVVIKNSLTAIGGRDSARGGNVTDQLFSLTGEGGNKKWTEVFPPMPTKRSHTSVVCIGKALIVAGGYDEAKNTMVKVEIMNIDTKQWSSAVDLPEPLADASVAICRESVYIGGGNTHVINSSKSVYTCTLADLFLSCQSRSLGECLAQSLSLTTQSRSTPWSKVADLPFVGSTCVTFHDQLLAIGGTYSGVVYKDVYQYHPISDKWEAISKMKTARFDCFAAVLPTNELMVVGGKVATQSGRCTDSVEIATVL